MVKRLHCELNDRTIFKELSFSMAQGELVHLQGKNGCGKTSLLNILAGLSPAANGEIYFHGSLSCKDEHYQQRIGYIGHKLGLLPHLTVAENLLFWRDLNREKSDVQAVLSAHQLDSYADYYLNELSQGLKKRVALCKLSLLNRDLWLLDEPFNALDKESQQRLNCQLSILKGEGKMILLSAHQTLSLPANQTLLL
jgi:heme exporter protein A